MTASPGRSGAARVAELILDALAVDGQLVQDSVIRKLASTEAGYAAAQWASNNPLLFEVVIRLFSATVRQYARDARGRGVLREALTDQLLSLPVVVRRELLAGHAPAGSSDRTVASPDWYASVTSALPHTATGIDDVAAVMSRGVMRGVSALVGVTSVVIQALDTKHEITPADLSPMALTLLAGGTSLDVEAVCSLVETRRGVILSGPDKAALRLIVAKANSMMAVRVAELARRDAANPEELIPENMTTSELADLQANVERLVAKAKREKQHVLRALPDGTRARLYDLLAQRATDSKAPVFHAVVFPVLCCLEELQAA